MNLSAVDLNLLLVVHTVLSEGSVTRAAARLSVTQSAISNALARARGVLGDPLFVKKGRGLAPTPAARELAPMLAAAMAQLEVAVGAGRGFDPARSERRFTLACSHYVEIGLLPRLTPAFAARLPRARLHVVTVDHALDRDGLATGEVDLLIGAPPMLPPGCEAEALFHEEMVCVARRDRRRFARGLDLESFLAARHVQVALQGGLAPIDGVDQALALLGRRREVAVSVAHHTTALMIAARTDLLATVPKVVVKWLPGAPPLRLLPPPLELREAPLVQIWSHRLSADPGLLLLRDLVRAAAARG